MLCIWHHAPSLEGNKTITILYDMGQNKAAVFYCAFTNVLSFQDETFIFGDTEQIYSDTHSLGKVCSFSKRSHGYSIFMVTTHCALIVTQPS